MRMRSVRSCLHILMFCYASATGVFVIIVKYLFSKRFRFIFIGLWGPVCVLNLCVDVNGFLLFF